MQSAICKQVIILGFDGATFDLIKPWASQGKLPAFAKLMETGAWGDLASTIPPHSPPAWSTFSTGLNPGKHGVIDFRRRKFGTYETVLTNGNHRRGYPIWRILSDHGRVVGVVNIPITYPPEPVNGCLISGMDTPESATNYTYPPDLASELIHETGNHISFVGAFLLEDMNAGRYDSAWNRIKKTLEWRIETVRYLLNSRDFNCFVVNFRATDAVQHHFWRFMDPTHPQYEEKAAASYGNCIYEVYKKLDDYLAEVWSDLDEESILVVMSDHGFGPASNKAVYLNNWLEQQGLLKSKNRAGRAWWRRYVPDSAKTVIRKLMPNLYDKARSPLSSFFFDWSETRAHADEYLQCIWINLVGRDPQGTVQPGDEYEELRSFIIEGLESLRDPDTGLPVVRKVYRREDIYWGTQLDILPDLQVEQRWEPFFQLRPSYTAPDLAPVRTLTPAKVMADRLLSGVHRPNGIFLAAGANIRPGKDLSGLKLIDLPPTILYLLGIPVPNSFDGTVLNEILQNPVPVEYTSEYDDESFRHQEDDDLYSGQDQESILERLRGLGYVD
jgi:predicted AlkP superfamily phosphohydrolase/phosphomutase